MQTRNSYYFGIYQYHINEEPACLFRYQTISGLCTGATFRCPHTLAMEYKVERDLKQEKKSRGKRVKRWRENKEGGRDEEEVECRL